MLNTLLTIISVTVMVLAAAGVYLVIITREADEKPTGEVTNLSTLVLGDKYVFTYYPHDGYGKHVSLGTFVGHDTVDEFDVIKLRKANNDLVSFRLSGLVKIEYA